MTETKTFDDRIFSFYPRLQMNYEITDQMSKSELSHHRDVIIEFRKFIKLLDELRDYFPIQFERDNVSKTLHNLWMNPQFIPQAIGLLNSEILKYAKAELKARQEKRNKEKKNLES